MIGKEPALNREELTKERKRIISNLILVLAAAFVVLIALGTMAWFVNSKEVTGENIVVTVQDGGYELMVAGDNIAPRIANEGKTLYDFPPVDDKGYTDKLPDGEVVSFSQKMVGDSVVDEEIEGYRTDSSKREIRWRLESNSNDNGLGPDSQGVFRFYVIPKKDGDITLRLSVRMEGYVAEQTKEDGQPYLIGEGGLVPVDSGSSEELQLAEQYLNEHFFFFAERMESTNAQGRKEYTYKGLYRKDGFIISIPDAQKDVPVQVELYWIWANTFGQLVFSGAENNGRIPVAANDATRTAIRTYLVENAEKIFADETKEVLLSKMARLQGATYVFNKDTVETGNNYRDLSKCYNEADQMIGTKLNYFLLIMTAE